MCSFLYVLTPNATTVEVLKLESPGNAKNVQKLDLAGPAKAAGVTISAYFPFLLALTLTDWLRLIAQMASTSKA